MASISRFITNRLKLQVNESKSAVDRPQNRSFLGFCFTGGQSAKRRKIAPKGPGAFQSAGQSADATQPGAKPGTSHHHPQSVPERVGELFWLLPNIQGAARLGQLDSPSSALPSMETVEGLSPTQGGIDQAWNQSGVGSHHGVQCERAVAHQSHAGCAHGAQQPVLRSNGADPPQCSSSHLTISNRHGRDPYAWWCGRGEAARFLPIPISLIGV